MASGPVQGKIFSSAALALLLAQAAPASMACRAYPAKLLLAPDALIAATPSIVIAKVLSAQFTADGKTTYSFAVQRRMAGADEAPFTISGAGPIAQDRNFDSHTDPDFWKDHGGRLAIGTDCRPYPMFEVGASYLVFRDGPIARRSFEKIEMLDEQQGTPDPQDRWLQYVENKLRALHRLE